MTKELLWAVTKEAVGAPGFAFPVPVAPIAPEPLVPEVFTPGKLITVIEETALMARLAVAVTLLSGAGANARQISAVPLCVLVRRTRTQVKPPPVMLVTLLLGPLVLETSEAIMARSSSLGIAVEKAEVVTEVAFVLRSPNAVASMVIPAETSSGVVFVVPS
jgi:hypothetical protein